MSIDDHWRAHRTQLRAQLEARRIQLTAELQRLNERIREHGSIPTLAKAEENDDACDLDIRLLEMANTTLRRVEQALERLREGCYERCTRCHGPIAKARLIAMPFAVCCRRCETARECETSSARSVRKSRLWEESQL